MKTQSIYLELQGKMAYVLTMSAPTAQVCFDRLLILVNFQEVDRHFIANGLREVFALDLLRRDIFNDVVGIPPRRRVSPLWFSRRFRFRSPEITILS